MGTGRRVAVIGSGVAGLTAAYVARSDGAHVTLYEADDRLGGHADTHLVDGPDGLLAIDTGFIVHNERTYPTLLRMFAELGVATQDSEMSMSTRDDATGLEWAGALGAGRAVPDLAQPRPAGVPADARRDPPLPPGRPCAAGRGRRRHHAASLPRRARLHGVLRPALHGARRRRGLVVRPGGRAGLPGALPLQLPRPPRHARRLRIAAVEDGGRRLALVRRPRRRAARRRPPRHQGHVGVRDAGTIGTASRSWTATATPRGTTRS